MKSLCFVLVLTASCALRSQMSFAQVNHEAWDVLSATSRYAALTAMKENCDIVLDEQVPDSELNLASRIVRQCQFSTTYLAIRLPLKQVGRA